MSSQHAFQRDLRRFGSILRLRGRLHHHHEVEDTAILPTSKTEQSELAVAIDILSAQHHRIDPLLARGDAEFAALPETAGAISPSRSCRRT